MPIFVSCWVISVSTCCIRHRQKTQSAVVQLTTSLTATGSVSVLSPLRLLAPVANHGTATSAIVKDPNLLATSRALHLGSSTSLHVLVCAHRAHQVKSVTLTAFAGLIFSILGNMTPDGNKSRKNSWLVQCDIFFYIHVYTQLMLIIRNSLSNKCSHCWLI